MRKRHWDSVDGKIGLSEAWSPSPRKTSRCQTDTLINIYLVPEKASPGRL